MSDWRNKVTAISSSRKEIWLFSPQVLATTVRFCDKTECSPQNLSQRHINDSKHSSWRTSGWTWSPPLQPPRPLGAWGKRLRRRCDHWLRRSYFRSFTRKTTKASAHSAWPCSRSPDPPHSRCDGGTGNSPHLYIYIAYSRGRLSRCPPSYQTHGTCYPSDDSKLKLC